MRSITFVSAALILIVAASTAVAVENFETVENIDAMHSFLLPPLDAAAMGRGSTNVSLSDGPSVLWWNPAAMSSREGTELVGSSSEAFFPFKRWSGAGTTNLGALRFGFAVDRSYAHAAYDSTLDKQTMDTSYAYLAGLLAASVNLNEAFDRDDDLFTVSTGMAYRLHRVDIDEEHWTAGGLDLGLRLQSRDFVLGHGASLDWSLGLAVANVTDAELKIGDRHVPQFVRWNSGGAVTVRRRRSTGGDDFSLTLSHERLSLSHEGDSFGDVERRYGAELVLANHIIARYGAVGDPALVLQDGWSRGLGVRFGDGDGRYTIQADYAAVETSGFLTPGDLTVFSLRLSLRDVTLGLSGE